MKPSAFCFSFTPRMSDYRSSVRKARCKMSGTTKLRNAPSVKKKTFILCAPSSKNKRNLKNSL